MNNAENKNSGGSQMSLCKRATRRLPLLAGSSLIAAIAAGSLLGAPSVVRAATNPCGDDPASDAAADVIVCPVATYPTGIQHTAVGDLDLTVQVGSNFGTGGVVTSAGASPTDPDNLIVRLTGPSTTAGTSFNTQAFPRLFDVQSQAGDILISLEAAAAGGARQFTANNAATTHFAYAVSQGGGDVTFMANSVGNISLQATGAASVAGIEARSVGGGDVTIDIGGGGNLLVTGGQHGILAATDGAGSINIDLQGTSAGAPNSTGRLYGIRAQASGTGTVSISGAGTTSGSTGLYGIHATTGTGLLTISATGASSAANGTGVFMDAGGDAVFTGRGTGGRYGIHAPDVVAGTTTTINLTGETTGGTAGILAAGAGTVQVNVIRSIGAFPVRTFNFDFTGMSAPVEVSINSGGAWLPTGSSTVPAGNFSIEIADDGALVAGIQGSGIEAPTVVTFSSPASSMTNTDVGFILVGAGDTQVGGDPTANEAELRLVGLGEFRNAGTITLGGCGYDCATAGFGTPIQGSIVDITDGWYDDLLVFQNGGWIGEGGKILFDADTNRTQTTCTRTAVTGDFGAADCVRIVNSTVEGVTYVNVREVLAGDRGRLTQQIMDEGILLIDAPGSTVTAENFVLDPTNDSYNAEANSIDKGLFQYVFLFDEEDSQFRLVGTLSGAAYQLPIAATAAHNMWRLSTGSWLNRQADLRGTLPEGLGGGIWLRASGEQTDREVATTSMLAGLPFTVDSTHRQDTYAITGGVDIFSGSDGNTGYVVGLMGGYAHSDIEYEASANTQAMDAWTGGIYGGLVVGQLFVDATVNANNVIIDTDAPGFGFLPEGTILSSRMISLGGQVEAGWRLLFDGGFFAEPLASVSYVRSKMDDLQIVPDDTSRPGLEVSYEDPSSFRAGVGARFGVDTDLSGLRTQVSLLARAWQDLEGQNTAAIHNLAFPDDEAIRVVDEFSDQFNEVAVGASVWAPNGIVSGFLNLGTKFGEDYNAKTGSVGVRVAW